VSGLINVLIIAIYATVAMMIGILFMGIGRKIVARVHNRVGPHISGFH